MRRLVISFLSVALGAVSPSLVAAQATGTISGLVTDESGAVIPGATIEVTSTATNQSRTVGTGANGLYTVSLLQPGTYAVKALLPGFRTTSREAVTVAVESTTRVDFRMVISEIVETITIDDNTVPLVETAHAQLGLSVAREQVLDLPLNGRNFTQLGTIMPGVVAPPPALGGGSGEATPGGFGAATSGFSVNGMRNQSNNFLLDGSSNNDTFNTGFVMRPPPDAIEEFKILTHSYNAEYGRNAGSVVNVVTRAGSNHPHGALWEFNRDDSLQARNFFSPPDQPKPRLHQNQYGGSLGGPIARDRLFGFGYYEGHRHTSGNTQNIVVLTDAQRSGNFGSATIRDPLTGLPFAGNAIPHERLDPTALRLVADFIPRANSGGNRYIASPDATDDRNQMGVRVDYHLTSSHSILTRYLRSGTEAAAPPTTRPIGGVSKATLQDFMVSDTHVLGPGAINVARFAYNRIGAHPAVTSGLSNSDYGIDVPHNVPSAMGLANILVTGFFSTGDAQQPFVDRLNEVFQFTNDFTWIKGSHSLKFGLDVRKEHMVIAFVNRPNGDFTFTGSPTSRTGNAAADFLLGLPAQFRRTTANANQDGTGWLYAGYVQGELRPSPRVTLNLGMRYELPLPFVDAHDALNAFRPGQQSTRFPEAPVGLVYPGDAGVPRGTYATDKNNFAPRAGLVWDPSGQGRWNIRAAWGIFYDALAGQGDFFQNGVLAPPFTPLVEVNAPPAALTLGNPLSAITDGAAGFPPGLTFIGWGEDFSTPYAHHFNLTWQRQFGNVMGAEVGYVGSRGKNLPIFMEVNPGAYTPGQKAVGPRLFPAFALVRPTFSVAGSWYDSLQASVRMRPRGGVGFVAAYTLGHARDHVSGLNIGGEQRPVLPVTIGDEASLQRALAFEKGDALFDVRHRLVVSFSAELPAVRGKGPILQHLTGGWQLTGIVQGQTGFPLTVFDPSLSIRFLTNRPNQVCDPQANAPRTVDVWFDTSCFVRRSLPETGEPGTTPRNSVRGPGFARTDLGLFKNIRFADRHRLQVRVEAFNLFNQARFGQPGNQIGTSNFGRITSADDGRIIELALKYNF
jgi:outer membrane receptor protein involved in Fe transport